MKVIRVNKNGGSEVLTLEDQPTPEPAKGQVLVKLGACGVNYIDTYQRSGLYKLPLPFSLGLEGAGVVEAVGAGVTTHKVGDRVAWTGVQGSYAEYTAVPATSAVPVPKGMEIEQAAAIMLQGLTAHYLCKDTYKVQKGDWVLVHAGAGGMGLLLTQMCKALGATVITTVSTEDKAELSRGAGADHVILYTQKDFEEEVNRIAGKNKLAVVYDAVGKTTFEKGLNLLRLRGMMVLYGQASGPVEPVDLGMLNAKGSLFVTRPGLFHYIATPEELKMRSDDVLGQVSRGELDVRIGKTFPLAEAKAAHDDLQGRRTTGKVLLIP